MKNRAEQVVLVTGGGQGIGRGICRQLAAEGRQVVAVDIDGEALAELEQELGDKSVVFCADVADEAAIQAVFAAVGERFDRLDALINNAGLTGTARVPLTELALADWNRMLSTNLTGTFLCSKHAIPLLRQNNGVIVNIASTRALQSEANTEAYSASKGGIVALTHALAVSLGPEIRVNCVSPGWIEVTGLKKQSRRQTVQLSAEDHRQHPVGRVGEARDIAAMVSYLISPAAGFISGQNFIVDGGMTRKMIYAE
ncbi:SDR family oxidoreductase [Pelobacter seleniigenes]|uniref:SDR family oxidoreductase n=1 Tax=Pelobacter seleniigenes TaxID=407188 RepID=UPI0004A7507D|nr:glucose 1-dehydrogenase [Pelobacter seleniigenes]